MRVSTDWADRARARECGLPDGGDAAAWSWLYRQRAMVAEEQGAQSKRAAPLVASDESACFAPGPDLTPADRLASLDYGDVRDAAKRAADHCYSIKVRGGRSGDMRTHCRAWGVEPPTQRGAPGVERMVCRSWWARKLRRASVRERERRRLGVRVSRYCSAQARRDYVRSQDEAAKWAAGSYLTRWDTGDQWSLAELIAKSTANPEVRAAELITRVKGCAQYAEETGRVGVLVTLTAPGSMHSISGDRWDGSTPREVQERLAGCWARFRAWVWRAWSVADRPFGVRVVEPHRDGCPHWHLVLFVPADRVDDLRDGLMRYFLGEWGPHRAADLQHRVKVDPVTGGADGAVGYVIKYVIKHTGSVGGPEVRALVGDAEIPGAKTADVNAVKAWASVWGLRTWQAVGGPPVTVWRLLRRVEGLGVEGVSMPGGLGVAVAAADCGDWAGYIGVQGLSKTGKRWPVCASMSLLRRESAGGNWYSAGRTRYGDEPGRVAVGILGDTDTASPVSVYVTRYRWVGESDGLGAVLAGPKRVSRPGQLGHVSLTVRSADDGAVCGCSSKDDHGSGGRCGAADGVFVGAGASFSVSPASAESGGDVCGGRDAWAG